MTSVNNNNNNNNNVTETKQPFLYKRSNYLEYFVSFFHRWTLFIFLLSIILLIFLAETVVYFCFNLTKKENNIMFLVTAFTSFVILIVASTLHCLRSKFDIDETPGFESIVDSNYKHNKRRIVIQGDKGTGKTKYLNENLFKRIITNKFYNLLFVLKVDLSSIDISNIGDLKKKISPVPYFSITFLWTIISILFSIMIFLLADSENINAWVLIMFFSVLSAYLLSILFVSSPFIFSKIIIFENMNRMISTKDIHSTIALTSEEIIQMIPKLIQLEDRHLIFEKENSNRGEDFVNNEFEHIDPKYITEHISITHTHLDAVKIICENLKKSSDEKLFEEFSDKEKEILVNVVDDLTRNRMHDDRLNTLRSLTFKLIIDRNNFNIRVILSRIKSLIYFYIKNQNRLKSMDINIFVLMFLSDFIAAIMMEFNFPHGQLSNYSLLLKFLSDQKINISMINDTKHRNMFEYWFVKSESGEFKYNEELIAAISNNVNGTLSFNLGDIEISIELMSSFSGAREFLEFFALYDSTKIKESLDDLVGKLAKVSDDFEIYKIIRIILNIIEGDKKNLGNGSYDIWLEWLEQNANEWFVYFKGDQKVDMSTIEKWLGNDIFHSDSMLKFIDSMLRSGIGYNNEKAIGHFIRLMNIDINIIERNMLFDNSVWMHSESDSGFIFYELDIDGIMQSLRIRNLDEFSDIFNKIHNTCDDVKILLIFNSNTNNEGYTELEWFNNDENFYRNNITDRIKQIIDDYFKRNELVIYGNESSSYFEREFLSEESILVDYINSIDFGYIEDIEDYGNPQFWAEWYSRQMVGIIKSKFKSMFINEKITHYDKWVDFSNVNEKLESILKISNDEISDDFLNEQNDYIKNHINRNEVIDELNKLSIIKEFPVVVTKESDDKDSLKLLFDNGYFGDLYKVLSTKQYYSNESINNTNNINKTQEGKFEVYKKYITNEKYFVIPYVSTTIYDSIAEERFTVEITKKTKEVLRVFKIFNYDEINKYITKIGDSWGYLAINMNENEIKNISTYNKEMEMIKSKMQSDEVELAISSIPYIRAGAIKKIIVNENELEELIEKIKATFPIKDKLNCLERINVRFRREFGNEDISLGYGKKEYWWNLVTGIDDVVEQDRLYSFIDEWILNSDEN